MREIEQRAADSGTPWNILMENAGLSIAQHIKAWLGALAHHQFLILVGPGNNGGDGLVTARHLHDWGARVQVYLCTERRDDDRNYTIVRQRGIPCVTATDDPQLVSLDGLLPSTDVVVDAIFGTGKVRPLAGTVKDILDKVRQARKARPDLRVVAVDLPSGVDAATGTVDPASLPADLTITLAYPKTGLYSFPAHDLLGQLVVGSIGLPEQLGQEIATELITDAYVKSVLPRRPRNAHKGTFGRLLVCAGSLNYVGAAYLACEGAVRVGAGLVTLAVARSLQPILAAKLTEVTYAPLPESEPGYIDSEAHQVLHEALADYDVLLMGCGLSQHQGVADFVHHSLLDMPPSLSPRLVLDADALNSLASTPDWWQRLRQDAILTPHPGEMARLTGLSTDEIGQHRLTTAQERAAQWGKTVVLKGAHTVVASPERHVRLSPVACAGLASAGTGDVLAGAIAGLAAQGLSPFEAATCGVYLHGRAGELVEAEVGDAGMAAGDLLTALPRVIKRIKEG